jgi:hypothetical protein
MEGASRASSSQPLLFPALKTASGGKIRASRFASGRSANNPLYRLGKIHLRSRTRVGAPILGNTIGGALAGMVQRNGKGGGSAMERKSLNGSKPGPVFLSSNAAAAQAGFQVEGRWDHEGSVMADLQGYAAAYPGGGDIVLAQAGGSLDNYDETDGLHVRVTDDTPWEDTDIVTARIMVDGSRSFGWEVAEFLGFHEGGFFHDLFSGVPTPDETGAYLSMTFRQVSTSAQNFNNRYQLATRAFGAVQAGGGVLEGIVGSGVTVAGLGTSQFGVGVPIAAGRVAETVEAAHPLAGMAARDVVDMAAARGLQTQRDSLILWSGLGRDGPVRAQAFAREFGGTTLEMTPGGKWLDSMDLYSPSSPFTSVEADMIWGEVSGRLVGQASGQVRSVLGQVRPGSVYRTYELPALQQNPAILGLDPLYLRPMFKASGY